MIVVRLQGGLGNQMQGGLGNQMFGYAAGRRLALSRGAPLVLDTSWKVQKGRFTVVVPR